MGAKNKAGNRKAFQGPARGKSQQYWEMVREMTAKQIEKQQLKNQEENK